MRRLHLQFYVAILATIAVFFCATILFWHLTTPPRGDAWGVEAASEFARTLLPAPGFDGPHRRVILEGVAKQLDADIALYDAQGAVVAVAGAPPTLARDRVMQARGWVFGYGGPMWVLPFDDGRRLVIHPRHHFPLHGPAITYVLAAVFLAFALGAYPIARRLTRRLARLREGVEQLGEGNLGARVAVEGRDEVAALARSFNTSAARVEDLVAAQKMLLANCSHELRTPLARLRLGIERLAQSSNDALRSELTRNIGELDALIEEMLFTSRLEAMHGLEHAEALDFTALAAEEAAHFERQVTGASVMVRGDAHLLRRLVRNLLENARVHGGGATLIEVSAVEGRARLVVEDRGGGVPEAEREKIFEPFHRGSGGATPARGSGLGLAIVRQIAIAHGGQVNCTGAEGGGARFVVTLPLR